MLFGFDDFDRTFAWFDDMHRRLEASLQGGQSHAGQAHPGQTHPGQVHATHDGAWNAAGWLRMRQTDTQVEVRADLPGVKGEDLDITLHGDVLTLTARRQLNRPEGFNRVHFHERRAFEVTRSLALPVRVDPERVGARLEDGVLTVTLAKAEAARPRQIAVQRD